MRNPPRPRTPAPEPPIWSPSPDSTRPRPTARMRLFWVERSSGDGGPSRLGLRIALSCTPPKQQPVRWTWMGRCTQRHRTRPRPCRPQRPPGEVRARVAGARLEHPHLPLHLDVHPPSQVPMPFRFNWHQDGGRQNRESIPPDGQGCRSSSPPGIPTSASPGGATLNSSWAAIWSTGSTGPAARHRLARPRKAPSR